MKPQSGELAQQTKGRACSPLRAFPRLAHWKRMGLVAATAALLAELMQGCVTSAKARADAQAAFAAGQRHAMANLGAGENQARLVTVIGEVRRPVLEWTPELTLARALVLAEFQGATDPAEVFIFRNGRALRSTAEELLKGEDVLLQPGDVIQLGRK